MYQVSACNRLYISLQHVVIVGTDIRLEPYDPDAEDEIKKTLEMFQSLPKISMSFSPIFADVEGSSA